MCSPGDTFLCWLPLLPVLLLLLVGETGDVNNRAHGSMLHFLDVEQPSANYRSKVQGRILLRA